MGKGWSCGQAVGPDEDPVNTMSLDGGRFYLIETSQAVLDN